MAQDFEIASLPPDVREKLAELELELSEAPEPKHNSRQPCCRAARGHARPLLSLLPSPCRLVDDATQLLPLESSMVCERHQHCHGTPWSELVVPAPTRTEACGTGLSLETGLRALQCDAVRFAVNMYGIYVDSRFSSTGKGPT
ncbi:hypothetical protein MRX96_006877 [Rhipicephalus microplus]